AAATGDNVAAARYQRGAAQVDIARRAILAARVQDNIAAASIDRDRIARIERDVAGRTCNEVASADVESRGAVEADRTGSEHTRHSTFAFDQDPAGACAQVGITNPHCPVA